MGMALAAFALGLVAAVASARWNWWRPLKPGGVRVLCYHKIGEQPPGTRSPYLWVSAEAFARQLDYLRDHGYTTMFFSELRDAELGHRPLPEKPVLITFDDGFANNYELAYPLLKERGLKANLFLVVEGVGGDSRWDRVPDVILPMLTWAQVREMQDAGVFEFGSHTLSHQDLGQAEPEEARRQLAQSKARLEKTLGREVVGFAYPYGAGAQKPEVRRLVREAGYHYDFGIEHAIAPWPWDAASAALPRLWVTQRDGALDFHLNMTRGRARFTRRDLYLD